MVLSSKIVDIVLDVPVERIEPIIWSYIPSHVKRFIACFNPIGSNGFSLQIDTTIRSRLSIIYFKGSHIKISQLCRT